MITVSERKPTHYTHSRRDGMYQRGDISGWTEAPQTGYTHPSIGWNGLSVTDLFCGAGGSSSGLVAAGYRVVIAANHWARAIESHQLNHPDTDHSNADISQVNPAYFPRTDLLWASPECTNHSVAKGVKRQRAENDALFDLDGTRPLPDEAANRSRATMWDVPRFAEHHRYKAIIIENVVDAFKWVMFPAWLQAMELLGYRHQIVWLNSMHAQGLGLPAPQSRDRMYIVFWRADIATKKRPAPRLEQWTRPVAVCREHGEIRAVQAFKKAEAWGRYRAQYLYRCPQCAVVIEPAWLPAASAIDWSIPGERIGDRKKPLAEKTRARIEKGIERYWRPLVVTAAGNTYDGITTGSQYLRARPVDEVMPTQHTTASEGLAVLPPFLTQFRERERSLDPARDPLNTLVADGAGHALVMTNNHGNRPKSVGEPLPTATTATTQALLVPVEGRVGKVAAPADGPMRTQSTRNETALVVPLRNHGVSKPATQPIDTVAANGNHHALVMRNNTARGEQGQMSTPASEPFRTLTTAGHQSLLTPYYGASEAAKPTSDPHGTLTTTDRYGLVESDISLDVDDVLFRMLTPDEIKRGMAFPDDYVLLGTKREQVRQSGNAVTPPAARDIGYAVAEFLMPELRGGRSMTDTKTINAVIRRDEGMCVIRGPYCIIRATVADHRAGRGQGGSTVLNDPANLIAACVLCNGWKEDATGEDRERLVLRGIRIEKPATNAQALDRARALPVLYPDGMYRLLTSDRKRTRISHGLAAELFEVYGIRAKAVA